jgi:hypothetical protein
VEFEVRCRALLSSLARSESGHSFHVAQADAPNVLSAWHSAHVALALRHADPAAAVAELSGLYAACQRENGLVSSERAFGAAARGARQGEVGPLFGEDGRSILVSPPVAAYAAAQLATLKGGAGRELLANATRELDAIWGHRLPPDTPLPVILHPLEAGYARSALFQTLVEVTDDDEWRDESATLLRSASACQVDPERALRAGHAFVVEDPVFCGWFLLALEECSRAWEKLGDGNACLKLRIRSEMIAEGISSRLWWDEQDLYAAWNRGRQGPLRAVTAGGLLPAAARSLVEEGTAKRALDRHLRPSASPLWGARGVTLFAAARDDERAVTPPIGALAHFWAHLALARADRSPDARVARSQLEELALERGFRASYANAAEEPEDQEHSDAFWPALALEMRAAEPGV